MPRLGAKLVMQSALEDAGMKPEEIDYINVHGTSTHVGDISEAKAIKEVFGDAAFKLNISSTKSMTGHLLGAAGAVEAMATVLAVQNDIVPPTINHEAGDEDPEIDYNLNFTFNKAQKREVRAGLSNTFGFIDRIKLPFRKEKELFSALYAILGFYPHNIEYYKQALMHKSIRKRNDKGKPLNNERLEFLGDAILDAVVGDVVFRQYDGKREGFLTNTRSKLVSRDTLGKVASEMGLGGLLLSAGHSTSHNSYVEGNALEALVGAIYLDRGYDTCMWFWEHRILGKYINIDKVAFKEVNFKSKLLEWSQKNRVHMEFQMLKQKKDDNGNPIFSFQVLLEGVEGEQGTGYSKKEAQQQAAKETLQRLKREPQFVDAIFAAKTNRTKMEEEPAMAVPDTEQEQDFIIEQPREQIDEQVTVPQKESESDEDYDLSDISTKPKEKSREEIIAEAEAAAFSEE